MIIDLLDRPRLPLGECDVCVLGAGPAGITLALTLAARRPDWQVVLAEAGGEALSTPEENDSYRPASDDPGTYPITATRLRLLGGTSNHWGGWSRPLDAEIFQPRPWMECDGWPIPYEALVPYYGSAATWCEIGATGYDADAHLDGSGSTLLDVADSPLLCHRLFRFSPPTRFGQRYRTELESTPNLQCWLNATATGLDLGDGQVREVEIAHRAGLRARLRARHFIVAMGGIENARFLLAQQKQAPAGSGLASPALGRYFGDHLGFLPAIALLPGRLDYGRRAHETGPVMPVLGLRPQAQRELGLPNCSLTLAPIDEPQVLPSRYGWNRAFGLRGEDYWWYRLQVVLEPQPNPDSRILLSSERDALGVPRVRVDWRMHGRDRERGERLMDALVRDLGSRRQGRLLLHPPASAFERAPTFVAHHMGSTRMGMEPGNSVVDADCRVHGVENLYIAGSSVFPAYGFSNPTLTIVALALRLADHLGGARSPGGGTG